MYRSALLVLLVTTTLVRGAHAASPAAPNAALQQEVGALVAELQLSARLKSDERNAWLGFAGVTWESRESPGAGTSVLGMQIDEAVRREMTRRRIPLVDASAPGLPRLEGRLLRAAFQTRWSGVRMSLSLLDARTGNVQAQVQQMLSPAALAGLAVEQIVPPDAAGALELAREIERGLGDGSPAFGLYVRTDGGSNAGYFVGDRFHVTLAADQDCHVRLYHVAWSDRRLTLVYPNRSNREGRLSAGVQRVLPGESPDMAFQVGLPYSVDALIAVASLSPFPDEGEVAAALAAGDGTLPAGFELIGDYLTVKGPDSARVQQALGTGRFVPLPAPPPAPAPAVDSASAPADSATSLGGAMVVDSLAALQEQLATPVPARTDSTGAIVGGAVADSLATPPAAPVAPPAASAAVPALREPPPVERPRNMARAACYLTALPILRPAR